MSWETIHTFVITVWPPWPLTKSVTRPEGAASIALAPGGGDDDDDGGVESVAL